MDLSSEIYHALLPAFVTIVLGFPATALGAIDGIAEATANFAKLASGRLSDRSQRRKPLILTGYGLAALTKPLFPLAASAPASWPRVSSTESARAFAGQPRDAMIADESPPEIRGRAFGLRQSLDTVGALLAPIAAIALMWAFAGDIRAVYWVAVIPALCSVALAWAALREPKKHVDIAKATPVLDGFRDLGRRHQAPAWNRLLVRARPLFGSLPDPQGD